MGDSISIIHAKEEIKMKDQQNNCSHPQMCPEKEPYFDVVNTIEDEYPVYQSLNKKTKSKKNKNSL